MIALESVLTPHELSHVRTTLAGATFIDGKLRGKGAGTVGQKKNAQIDFEDPVALALTDIVKTALMRHPTFPLYARPSRWTKMRFARYVPGSGYGMHVDFPVMQDDRGLVRSDLSFTLYLSDPDSYDGGELHLDMNGESKTVKLEAGNAIVYSTRVPHCVAPITRGERYVCVGWIQSVLRREDQREIVYDLTRLRSAVAEGGEPRLLLEKALGNLVRLWAET
jgi:PKHD-type hydroxylase